MAYRFTVTELNQHVKNLLESAPFFRGVEVSGEIADFKQHTSGHRYFTIKDASGQLTCVIFRTQRLDFIPKNGDKVLITADLTVYAARGIYQLQVSSMKLEGLGTLFQQFVELRDKLAREGLFEEARKRSWTRYPRTIGVVTSATGAVIEDIQTTLSRRHPLTKVLLAPSLVQGPEAPANLIASLQKLEAHEEVDLIIIGRGGGSMEDLWCFNDEQLVRAIAACKKPVIAAIGHETDFTLSDFAADHRAPTPTAAAELAAADLNEVKAWLVDASRNLVKRMENRLLQRSQWLDDMEDRLTIQVEGRMKMIRQFLESKEALLKASHFETVLQRGYSITLHQGRVVKSIQDVSKGQTISTRLSDGTIVSTVTDQLQA